MEQKLLKLEPRLLSDFFFVLLFSGQLKLHQAWWAPGIHKEAGRLHPAERGEDSIHPVKALSELAGSGCWNSSRSTAASQSSVQCGQWLMGLFSGLRWLHQCHVKDTGQEKAEQLELKHFSPWPLKLSTDGALLLPVQAGNSSCHFSVPLERYTVKWCRWLCGYFQFNSYLLHLTGTDTLNKLLWYPADLWTRVFVQISCWFTQHHIHKYLHL